MDETHGLLVVPLEGHHASNELLMGEDLSHAERLPLAPRVQPLCRRRASRSAVTAYFLRRLGYRISVVVMLLALALALVRCPRRRRRRAWRTSNERRTILRRLGPGSRIVGRIHRFRKSRRSSTDRSDSLRYHAANFSRSSQSGRITVWHEPRTACRCTSENFQDLTNKSVVLRNLAPPGLSPGAQGPGAKPPDPRSHRGRSQSCQRNDTRMVRNNAQFTKHRQSDTCR